MSTNFELRLSGGSAATGEIRLAHLGHLSAALQELSTRVGRHVQGRSGPGRSQAVIESLTALTLVAVGAGSTVLHVRRGDDAALELDLSLERDVDSTLFDVLTAVQVAERPAWMGDALAESTGRFVAALRAASRSAIVTYAERGSIELGSASLDSRVWSRAGGHPEGEVTLIGRLTAVDVESSRFSIRDDAGSRVPLDNVLDTDVAAGLIGRRVRARGLSIRDQQGYITRLTEVQLMDATEQPLPWAPQTRADVGGIVRQAPGPDPDGGVVVSDAEYDAFLQALHG